MTKYFQISNLIDKRNLYAVVILFSLSSIHYVSFVTAMPSPIHPLLDASFKASFIANILFVGTFSVAVARYAPQALLAITVLLISITIEIIYTQRGYDRAAVASGGFIKGRIRDKIEAKKHRDRMNRFGRFEARLNNFVTDKAQSLLPILTYEKNRTALTYFGSMFLVLLMYIGFSKAFMLVSFGAVVFVSLHTYYGMNDTFRFKMMGYGFVNESEDSEPSERSFSSLDFFVAAVTCAILVAISGPIRLEKLVNGPHVEVSFDGEVISASIIAATSSGFIVNDGNFRFIPFSGILIKE